MTPHTILLLDDAPDVLRIALQASEHLPPRMSVGVWRPESDAWICRK